MDPFAMVMFVETDLPTGTAFEVGFQIVNPRVQANNWFLPRNVASMASAVGHSIFSMSMAAGTRLILTQARLLLTGTLILSWQTYQFMGQRLILPLYTPYRVRPSLCGGWSPHIQP
jgi:hypothetical protein